MQSYTTSQPKTVMTHISLSTSKSTNLRASGNELWSESNSSNWTDTLSIIQGQDTGYDEGIVNVADLNSDGLSDIIVFESSTSEYS